MIKEQAVVIARDTESEGRISVRVDRKSSCETCQVKSACGQKLLNEGRQGKCIEFELDNLKGANVGDEVTIAIPEDSFLQAAFVMYVLPLITMIAAAVLGEKYFLLSDGGVFLVSSLGFALGLLMVRKFADSKRSQADFQPQVIAVSSSRKLPENNL